MRDAGSTTIITADKIKLVGAALLMAGGGTGAAQQSGIVVSPAPVVAPDLLGPASDVLKEMTALRALTNGFADVLGWAWAHWWLLLIVGGYFVWKWGRDIQWRRLLAHNLGLNLSK